ncbi:hypothetical protein [Pseudobacteriovorax antillogorgiicola]|uniref:Uncharacterized protein n=2 Tax=Pseudobacteriovorax antillogorgiicola TaxID=1513793 RepID=A0A1Y6C2P4_9BACT|nr:hypothetical protein [Pseudobacteriovorax antillogorgiicola]TCS50281.1 hypothetical protein EDD56_11399 [Pseudobacteriovorax antillogorgiicola]SMF33609.1 hypothetical protein SAMN06296036_11098 [Pseudobacteriovorax antillogorgiicola]
MMCKVMIFSLLITSAQLVAGVQGSGGNARSNIFVEKSMLRQLIRDELTGDSPVITIKNNKHTIEKVDIPSLEIHTKCNDRKYLIRSVEE